LNAFVTCFGFCLVLRGILADARFECFDVSCRGRVAGINQVNVRGTGALDAKLRCCRKRQTEGNEEKTENGGFH